ncbi:MAG: alpha/beta hydrolase [Hyphomicrobiaceae bacterium]|nr:MAG: alpha/beta hydrolase [Hyphomicrobiaceae bacterium]
MALDIHVRALLDLMAAAGRPKTWQLTPAEAREGLLALANVADAQGVPIGRVENAELPGPGGPLRFRSYTPVSADATRLPGLVYFHGGGFVIGDLDTHDGMCRMLANASGCRLISIDYRLAPEHPFPAAVEDAFAATGWVGEHAADLGIDPSRLGVAGDSAGANLAAVVAQLATRAGRPKLALQVLLCPRTDAAADTKSLRDFAEGYLLEAAAMQWFADHYGARDPHDPRVSPMRADSVAGLPPAHIHTAAYDPLRDEGKAYADRLAGAGVAVEYTCHPGMIHHFYALAGAIPYARTAIEQVGAAIKRALA